ncbi:hypothetical protein [Rhodococcus ruber]|uniref:hypothetical protein n=1 Tax=Rhodococcus ruber TaxID=1830 RepID=UPI00315D1866
MSAIGRARAWSVAEADASEYAIDEQHPLILDINALLTTTPTRNPPLQDSSSATDVTHCAHAATTDRSYQQTRPEAAAPGDVGSNTAADHVTVIADALIPLPSGPSYRVEKEMVERIDGTCHRQALLDYLTEGRLWYPGVGWTDTLARRST